VNTLLSAKQFFRLNGQYLINFSTVREVEHYFARKLLVKLVVPRPEKLLIGKEKDYRFFKLARKQVINPEIKKTLKLRVNVLIHRHRNCC